MARRCGCTSSICSCFVTGVGNATVTGTGTETNPYVVDVDAAVLTVVDTASLNLTLSGAGTPEDPYVLSGISSGGSGGLDAEQLMDYLGGVTTPAQGLKGTGLISVSYNDTNGTLTVATTATANSTDAFLLARANHTGEVALNTMASDWSNTAPTAGQYPVFTGGVWTPTTPPNPALKADKSGSVSQFADWSDVAPAGTGIVIPVWDPGISAYVPTDMSLVFASLDSTGRLLAQQRPKYDPDIVVIVEGDSVPGDVGAGGVGGIVFQETAAPSIVPTGHGVNGGANIAAATGVTETTDTDINPGDLVTLFVGASGEATLPSTYIITLAAGAVTGSFTAVPPAAIQGTSTQQDILTAVCSTLIPAGTNITCKANQARVELILGIASIANVDSPALDKDAEGQGGSSTTLALSTASSGTLALADEVCVFAALINSGMPVIRSMDATPGSGWIPLFSQFNASAAGSSRGMRAWYKVVDTTAPVQGQFTVTSSDGNSGAWSAKLATFKAAP